MKVIVAYASCGSGHTKAAEALYGYLKEHRKDVQVQLIDILDTTPYLFRLVYRQGYFFLVNHALFLWRFGFWFTKTGFLRSFSRRIGALINRPFTKRFTRMLISQKPDYCIATHFLVAEIAAGVKKRYDTGLRVFNVITDFEVHPFWISQGIDRYFVASELTKKRTLRFGVPERLIQVSGIPAEEKFLSAYDKKTLRAKYGIAPGAFCVFMTTGSFGVGPLEELVRLLQPHAHVLVGCAHNKALCRKLERDKWPNVRVFGFVNYVHELLAITDALVTKPGGLTITESLLMRIPFFFSMAIPGQEEGNIAVLKEYGLSGGIQKPHEIITSILRLKNDPQLSARLKEIMSQIRKPDAAKVICDAIR